MDLFKTKKFKELQKKWYKKIEKEGFKDIETDEDHLKEWDSHIFSRYSPHIMASKEEYFRLAGQFSNSYEFESLRERLIWEYHAEGLSFNEISEKLKKRGYKVHSRSSMHIIVKKLADEMFKRYGITNK